MIERIFDSFISSWIDNFLYNQTISNPKLILFLNMRQQFTILILLYRSFIMTLFIEGHLYLYRGFYLDIVHSLYVLYILVY